MDMTKMRSSEISQKHSVGLLRVIAFTFLVGLFESGLMVLLRILIAKFKS